MDLVLSSAELLSLVEERATAGQAAGGANGAPLASKPVREGAPAGAGDAPTTDAAAAGAAAAAAAAAGTPASVPVTTAGVSLGPSRHALSLLAASPVDLPPDLARFSSLVCPHASPGASNDGGSSPRGGGGVDRVVGEGSSRRVEEGGPGGGGTSLFSYAAPGASGGAADFVFRAAATELFGIRIPEGEPLPWVAGRNADTSELTLQVEGEVKLRCGRMGPPRCEPASYLKHGEPVCTCARRPCPMRRRGTVSPAVHGTLHPLGARFAGRAAGSSARPPTPRARTHSLMRNRMATSPLRLTAEALCLAPRTPHHPFRPRSSAACSFVRAYGFRNIQNVVRRVKTGRCAYSFVEVMACPAGCANGGGQPRPPPLEAMERAEAVEAAAVAPAEAVPRAPSDNPSVRAVYADGGYLAGGPGGARARERLHTSFHAVTDEPPDAAQTLAIQW